MMRNANRWSSHGVLTLLGLFLVIEQATYGQEQTLSLAGVWRFQLDPENLGVTQQWWGRDFSDQINLPGFLQGQGYGDPPGPQSQWLAGIGLKRANDPLFADYFKEGDFLSPFFLTPRRHYVGPAWYQRDVVIPRDWEGCHITLTLERVHWESRVWIDNQELGRQDSLAAPHIYDVSQILSPGKHRVTIRVDNSYIIPVGKSAHSVSDETQGNWNGIIGKIALEATPPVWIEDVQVFPRAKERSVDVEVMIGNLTGQPGKGQLRLAAATFHRNGGPSLESAHHVSPLVQPVEWSAEGAKIRLRYDLGENALLWDEFHPNLYTLDLVLENQSASGRDGRESSANKVPRFSHRRSVVFGVRDLEIRGTQFVLNGRPIFLRGTLECCIFPRTGHPPMDPESWREIFRVARSYGLNHLRFHSWCPPEAAFDAADEMGFYLQVECSCWTSFGNGDPQDAFVYAEAERIRRAYGNHPSFLLLVASNEPGGVAQKANAFLAQWVETQRAADPRRCYSAGSGWPQIPANQFHIQPHTRLQKWEPLQLNKSPQTWDDYREYIEQLGVPTISHEIGQWCAYPNVVSEPEKYQGFLRGSNVEVFRDILKKKGMWDQAEAFIRASGRFQVALYKQEIETALRTPGMAGFQLLDLHDFPGQGTAPVGVLDAFWQEKGYCSPEEYSRFCNSTVLLARLKKRIFTRDETLEFRIDVANYGPSELKGAIIEWELRQQADVLAQGALPPRDYPTGKLGEGEVLSIPLTKLDRMKTPAALSLIARLKGTSYENDWTIWVYPSASPIKQEERVPITRDPEEAWNLAQGGQSVLLLPVPNAIAGDTLGTFQPIFWNRITFPSQSVHMLGILCDPEHPALKSFPTSFHADWQWQELLDACKPMILDRLSEKIRPIVQAIDDWCEARRLGLVWEARVGTGRVLVCSIDIVNDLSTRVVARQLRASLVDYLQVAPPQPLVTLTREEWETLWRTPCLLKRLGAKVSADSFEPGFEPSLAMDDDPNTMWHSAWTPKPARLPHQIVIDLQQPLAISGLRILPRQDGNPNGLVAEFEVYVSEDGKSWGDPIARGTWDPRPVERIIRFSRSITAQWIKFVAKREIRSQQFTSIAELDIIPSE
ncbi:MAG: discoidin domain-containing protein [Thermogutta sp.]